MAADYPAFENHYGVLRHNMDMLPKPSDGKIPMLITGSSQQSTDWIAQHGDGWMIYPRNATVQANIIKQWREQVVLAGLAIKPVMEPLYIDLTDDPDTTPQPIHLGLRLGSKYLIEYLQLRRAIGVNHIALNLRFNSINIDETLARLAEEVLPVFHKTGGNNV